MAVDLSLVPPTVGPRFVRHDGGAAGADDDFIVLPDPAIGEVVSAGTNRTLRGYHKASHTLMNARIALAVLGAIFGALFGFNVTKYGLEFVGDLLELELDPALIQLCALGAMGAGAVERLDKPAIQSMTLQQGTLIIKRQNAKEGLFRSEGVFRFPVSAMQDFRTFLVALEASTGFRFS